MDENHEDKQNGSEASSTTSKDRLSNCEVCSTKAAKYCCPRCEVKTCSLPCLKIHKKELDCNGIRDRVKFRSMSAFSNMDVLSDYRMLEEIGRAVDNYSKFSHTHRSGPYELPKHLVCLRAAAARRNVQLHFLPRHFVRRQNNSTQLNFGSQELYWRVEWVFPQADFLKFTSNRVLDSTRLCNAVDEFLDPFKTKDKKMQFYQAAGHGGVILLLKAEKVLGDRYFELDSSVSLRDNLAGKIILEHPIIHVLMKDHKESYDILSAEDEMEVSERIEQDTQSRRSNNRFRQRRKQRLNGKSNNDGGNDDLSNIDVGNNYLFSNEDIVTSSDVRGVESNAGLQIPDYNAL